MSLIFLIGPRGSGKTTVAQLLARRLGWDWLDADIELEKEAGRSIRTIFQEEGEAGFRARETAVLRRLCTRSNSVIATGGGVVLAEENRQLLQSSGTVIWLTAEAKTLWRRLQGDASTAERRPNLTATGGLEEIHQVLARREPLYRACAHHVLPTVNRTPDELAHELQTWWLTQYGS